MLLFPDTAINPLSCVCLLDVWGVQTPPCSPMYIHIPSVCETQVLAVGRAFCLCSTLFTQERSSRRRSWLFCAAVFPLIPSLAHLVCGCLSLAPLQLQPWRFCCCFCFNEMGAETQYLWDLTMQVLVYSLLPLFLLRHIF